MLYVLSIDCNIGVVFGFDRIARRENTHADETYVSDGIAKLEEMLANETVMAVA